MRFFLTEISWLVCDGCMMLYRRWKEMVSVAKWWGVGRHRRWQSCDGRLGRRRWFWRASEPFGAFIGFNGDSLIRIINFCWERAENLGGCFFRMVLFGQLFCSVRVF